MKEVTLQYFKEHTREVYLQLHFNPIVVNTNGRRVVLIMSDYNEGFNQESSLVDILTKYGKH